jgi:CDP-diglyceride synthetase
MILRSDAKYRLWAETHKMHPWSLLFFGTLFSFKLHKFFFTIFWGNERITLTDEKKVHRFFNILTTLNLVFVLTPVILIDVYGLSKYKWGSQFYVMMIETLIFALSMIVVHIIEMRRPKPEGAEENMYSGLNDMSD